MKKISSGLSIFVIALAVTITGAACEPNGNRNSTDAENTINEGAVDSTKLPGYGANDSITLRPSDSVNPVR